MTLEKLTEMVRGYIKDIESLNRLKGFKIEFSVSDIKSASNLALLKINNKYAVKTAHTLKDCPEYLLLLGTVERLLSSEIMLKARNSLTVSDGGGVINREGNIQLYERLKAEVKNEFETELFDYKNNLNFLGGW